MTKKEVNCKFFLPNSKVCCAPTEFENPPGYPIRCVRPKDPSKCPVKEYYADPGPYVLGQDISLFEFIQKRRK